LTIFIERIIIFLWKASKAVFTVISKEFKCFNHLLYKECTINEMGIGILSRDYFLILKIFH